MVSGALAQCSFGAFPTPVNALPDKRVLVCGRPILTITDNKPLVNLFSFGMCSNPANPAVAAATAAALGVLTPMPCLPVASGPWTPGCPRLLIGGTPAVDQDCRLACAYGGVISFVMAGQFAVQTGG